MRFLFTILIISVVLNACSGTETRKVKKPTIANNGASPTEKFPVSELIPSVALASAPAETFALYLPSLFSDTATLPLLIFFDPHGEGALPLEKYKLLAEKHQCILAGSNFSSNDRLFQENLNDAEKLINELRTRFHTRRKISLAGFSGGAKVALQAGAKNETIEQVIYSGSVLEIEPRHLLELLCLAGDRDMNYPELVLFNASLSQQLPHFIKKWEGKHEWPAAEIFETAFHMASSLPENTFTAYGPEELRYFNKEGEIHRDLAMAFEQKDMEWWKHTIEMLRRQPNDPVSVRTLGFISLAGYSLTSRALQEKQIPLAKKSLEIYSIADPSNPDVAKLSERLK